MSFTEKIKVKFKPPQKGRSSIFVRYFVLFAAIMAISFTALGTLLLFSMTNYWQEEKTQLLVDNTKSIATTVRSVSERDSINPSYSPTKSMIANTLAIVSSSIDSDIFIIDNTGRSVLCKEKAGSGIQDFHFCEYHDAITIDDTAISEIIETGNVNTRQKINGTHNYVVGEAIMLNGEQIGSVIALTPVDFARTFILDVLRMFLTCAIFAMLLSFISVYYMTYQMMQPLEQMSRAAKKFAKGDFSHRVRVRSNDEMTDLANAFNEMATSLASLESSRRSFVANVSHELKTPMTTIAGFIDGILDGTIPPEKEGYYLNIVSQEVKRLARLVVSMLEMSKIETGDFKIQKKNYDIAEQIFRVFLNFEQKITEKAIEIIGMDKLSPTKIVADEDMIYQVIYNLVDNAVKFTNVGGYIMIELIETDKKIQVSIKNSGDGINADDLPKVFERFYKTDRSRSVDTKGTGLGLYIVKAAVEQHGGEISVASVKDELTEFTFIIPKE